MAGHLMHNFLYAFIALFPVVNPIAMSSVFHSLTQHVTKEERVLLAKKVTLYGTALLLGTLILGPFILLFFWYTISGYSNCRWFGCIFNCVENVESCQRV